MSLQYKERSTQHIDPEVKSDLRVLKPAFSTPFTPEGLPGILQLTPYSYERTQTRSWTFVDWKGQQ